MLDGLLFKLEVGVFNADCCRQFYSNCWRQICPHCFQSGRSCYTWRFELCGGWLNFRGTSSLAIRGRGSEISSFCMGRRMLTLRYEKLFLNAALGCFR